VHRQFPPPLRTPATHVRRVSGEILTATTTTTSVGRIEMLSRRLPEPQVEWQFCQPELTLFWHREGFHRMHGWIDGRRVNCDFAGGANLSVFAPEARIRTEFDTDHDCSYVAVFFDADLVRTRYGIGPTSNKVGFHSEVLRRALADICTQAACPDGLFQLYAEG
jgi:AraC family transcriptional regulator